MSCFTHCDGYRSQTLSLGRSNVEPFLVPTSRSTRGVRLSFCSIQVHQFRLDVSKESTQAHMILLARTQVSGLQPGMGHIVERRNGRHGHVWRLPWLVYVSLAQARVFLKKETSTEKILPPKTSWWASLWYTFLIDVGRATPGLGALK